MLGKLSAADATDMKELTFWQPTLAGFPSIANDPIPVFERDFVDTVQRFKCCFPAVTKKLPSDEKRTDKIEEQDVLALSLVASLPQRQSHTQI